MSSSLYQKDTNKNVHRGAIYEYRPVFWLNPPLWCIRNIQWGNQPPVGVLYQHAELSNAFRQRAEKEEENVMARAKVRYVIVISHDHYCKLRGIEEVIILPTYTLKPDKPDFVKDVRSGVYPHIFHLAEDPSFPQMRECFIDYREVRPLNKAFLQDGKLTIAFTPIAIKAILQGYIKFLQIS